MRSFVYAACLAVSMLAVPALAQDAPSQKDHPLKVGPYDLMVTEVISDNGTHLVLKSEHLNGLMVSGADLEEVTGDFGKMLNALGVPDIKGHKGFIDHLTEASRADGAVETVVVKDDPKDGKIVMMTLRDFPGLTFVAPEWAYFNYSEQVAIDTPVKLLFLPMGDGKALVVSTNPDQTEETTSD